MSGLPEHLRVRRQVALGQRCGKWQQVRAPAHDRRCAPARLPRATATQSLVRSSRLRFRCRSSLSAASFVLAARPAPEVCFGFSLRREERGRRARRRDVIRLCTSSCEDVAPSGAPLRRSPPASGRALRRRSYLASRFAFRTKSQANVPAPVAMLLAGGSYWPPGGAPTPPGCVACSPRARAPVRSTRAGATGSRPSWERTIIGILSHRNIVKIRFVEKNGAGGMKRCAIGTRQIRHAAARAPTRARTHAPIRAKRAAKRAKRRTQNLWSAPARRAENPGAGRRHSGNDHGDRRHVAPVVRFRHGRTCSGHPRFACRL